MKYRVFGKTNWKVSEVGLGTWQLGGMGWGDVSEKEAMEVLQRAVERGVNFFDTADVYGDGRSEQLLGQFLKKSDKKGLCRNKIWAETKSSCYLRIHKGKS